MKPEQKKEFIATMLSRMVMLTERNTFVCTGCDCEGTSLDPLKLPHTPDCKAFSSMKMLAERPEILDHLDPENYT